MTTLAIAALFVGTLGYVLWPVFRPVDRPVDRPARPGELDSTAIASTSDHAPTPTPTPGDPLPLEQLEPPPGER